jgi:acyl-CoA synthetase (AMP-forming)/AMP-acid ligase II
MLEELVFELGISTTTLYYIFIASGITTGLFMQYVFFPLLEKYEEQFDKYFPTVITTVLVSILLYSEHYIVIALSIVWAAFIVIVLNSNKYPRVNKIFDSIF